MSYNGGGNLIGKSDREENMKLSDGKKVPDFIIIGAMKSGTSTIHSILSEREDVFMPEKEVYFFDVDDIEQHPDFFVRTSAGWTYHDFEKDFDTYYSWYSRFFQAAGDDMFVGEDTTTYKNPIIISQNKHFYYFFHTMG